MTRVRGFWKRFHGGMLAHSAWDFYFNRAEREILLHRLRTKGSCPSEEVCLKARNGAPIWVLASGLWRTFAGSIPKLLLSTVIDITAQKKAQARPRDIKGVQPSDRCRHAKAFGQLIYPNG